MAVIKELIRGEVNGAVSFGNYKLSEKGKVEDFNHEGDLYKVKTFNTMTKLEKNGLFLYESVPGTSAINFIEDENGVSFFVTGDGDVQITVGLEEDTEYEVFVEENAIGKMKTNMGGKLSFSVSLTDGEEVAVKVVKQ